MINTLIIFYIETYCSISLCVDIGCQAGGSLSCQNGGNCVGTQCICATGYSGQTCATCEYFFLNFGICHFY